MQFETSQVLDLIKKLAHPEGCPWMQMQEVEALCQYIIEESYEVIDAISQKNEEEIQEELGDVLFATLTALFVACQKNSYKPQKIIEGICAKVKRRHPHVFENPHKITLDELRVQWQEIKAKERAHKANAHQKKDKHPLDCITPKMPLLMRAMKLAELGKTYDFAFNFDDSNLEERFMQLVLETVEKHEHSEKVFEKGLKKYEEALRNWLSQKKTGDNLLT